ncbi:MAG: hypothetical protein JXP73_09205 [Deltaproteobacteria bacterium]|nr:hypothetical protein [Deltaproteobacteria bacterium]
MSHPTEDPPARLRVADGTDFERRLLDAAASEQPPPELSARMAAAIGISAEASAVTLAASAATGTSTKGAAASRVLLPWISAGVVVLGIGGFVGIRAWTSSVAPTPRAPPPAAAPAMAPPPPGSARPIEPAVPGEAARALAAPPVARRRQVAATAPALREQIALLDAARAATAAGAGERALVHLRRYEARYPAGAFRPEAGALRIEALVELGRMDEARALVEQFVAEHGASPLADRVARLVRDVGP